MADVTIRLRGENDTGPAVGEATQQLEGLKKTTNESGFSLEQSAKSAAVFAAGLLAVGKAALVLGKEGATITATAESLERLATASGHAGDLAEQLEKAAGGTVDDLDYMGSTIRLLTGETGEFARKLADAAPNLLTMARAAVKLNPTSGDTAAAYEAITKAVEA